MSPSQTPLLSADSGVVSPAPPAIAARGATPWPLPPVRTSLGESSTKPGESGTKYKAVASTEPADEPSRSTLKNVLATDTAAIEDGIRVDSTTIAAGPTQTESAMPTAPRVADAAASARPLTKPRTAEDEAFLSPERSAPEQASVYVTATEAGGVRGLFQKLRGKLQEAGASLGKEILPRNKAGRDAADEKEEMAGQSKVQLPAQATPPKPTGIANTEGQSCAASDELNIDVVAEAIHASTRYVAESVDIAAAQGIDVLPSRSRGAKFVYPDKELHRTPSKFADWPKHEAEIIPDPECVIFPNNVTGEVDDPPMAAPSERRQSLVLRASQLLGRKQSEQSVHWEPVFSSKSKHAPSSKAKSKQEPPAPSLRTDTAVHGRPIRGRNIADTTDVSSADTSENVLEGTSCLYRVESTLDIDSCIAKRSVSRSRRRNEEPSSPHKDRFTGSGINLLTRSSLTAATDVIVTATPRRYWILFMFCVTSMINAFQWIQYSIIASVLTHHYGVSEIAISWTSMLYLIGYMTLAFPSAWILDNMGLRDTVLIGAAGTAIGACIKTYAVRPGQFTIVLIGQAFPAFAQAFILGVPPRLASAWFKYEEVSTACSLGVLGNNLGIALGFVIPPNVVDAHNATAALLYLCTAVTIVSCACLFVLMVSFQDQPQHPPSFSEMLRRATSTKESFGKTFTTLLKDRNFLLLLGSYGLNTGAFYSISTLLNPVILVYFPGEEPFAGWLGLALIVAGLIGSWLCGAALDKTGKYKEVTLGTYLLATVGLFAYTFLLSARSHALSLVACIFLGFFMTGYLPIGLQLAAEITYPLPEGMSSNMMNVSAQAVGFLMILLSGYLQDTFGDITANLCLVAALLVGSIMTTCIKADLKRQQAIKRESIRRSSSTASSKVSRH